MRKLLIILAVTLLPGCALMDAYLMKYDTNEYRVISEIRAEAHEYKLACANDLLSTTNSVAMANKTQFFVFYAQYIPHNNPVKNASVELNKIAQGLKEQYTMRSVTVAWTPTEATAAGKWEGEIIKRWFPLCVL
jgi:hypothetical protein